MTYSIQTIPWQNKQDWQEAAFFIRTIEKVKKHSLDPVYHLAHEIRLLFEALSDPIEQLCSATCPGCLDICCKRATIWYDFKDLLYLYFGMEIFPDNQIKKIPGTISPQCSNLTEIGCCLPRRERPFVCTWYFCPDQTRTAQYQNGSFAEKIIEIKKLRNQMEEIFCLVSSS